MNAGDAEAGIPPFVLVDKRTIEVDVLRWSCGWASRHVVGGNALGLNLRSVCWSG